MGLLRRTILQLTLRIAPQLVHHSQIGPNGGFGVRPSPCSRLYVVFYVRLSGKLREGPLPKAEGMFVVWHYIYELSDIPYVNSGSLCGFLNPFTFACDRRCVCHDNGDLC